MNDYKSKLKAFLSNEVLVIVDRPLGSRHPKHPNIIYKVNYGYIDDLIAPDGEKQDAYVLGVDEPVKEFKGVVIAIIERMDDVENKLVVAPLGMNYSDKQIEEVVRFQEQYFHHQIIRG